MPWKLIFLQRFRRRALVVFALLNILDIATSWIDFHLGAWEGNPLIAFLLAQIGFGGLLLYKLGVVLTISVGVLLLERLHAYRVELYILALGICFGLFWVVANVLQLLFH